MSIVEEDKVVISDLLCYMQCKLDAVPKESLVQVISNFYKLESIVAAREILYEDLPSSLPRVVRHINKKDNVSVMYDVMQSTLAQNKIVFVCKDLNNIPPLSLKNVDPVMLLRQATDMQDEIGELKVDNRAMKVELAEIKKFVSDIRDNMCSSPVKSSPATYSSLVKGKRRRRTHSPPPASQACVELISSARDNDDETLSNSDGNFRQDTARDELAIDNAYKEYISKPGAHNQWLGTSSSRFHMDKDGFIHRKPRQRKPPVIGKGNSSNLRVVTVRKRKQLFVSRLHEETTPEELKVFVESVTDGSTVEVEKLRNKYPGYASFRISCEERCSEVLLNENTWDKGILIRPFFNAKKNVVSNNVNVSQDNGGQK